MTKLPQIRRKISDFLTSEEGKITKKSVITLSLVTAGTGILLLNSALVESATRDIKWTYNWENTGSNPNSIYHYSHCSY